MALEGSGRVLSSERGRTLLYISQKVAGDSAFPFQQGDSLFIKIDKSGKRLIIEAAPESKPKTKS